MPDLPPRPDPGRLLGCLLGGAIGDALGAPIEGYSLGRIRALHGPSGLTGFSAERFGAGAITDDTQLTMFTAYALVRAAERARTRGFGGSHLTLLQLAYLTWLRGQGETFPDMDVHGGGWLESETALMTRRGPGRSTIAALHKVAAQPSRGTPLGTIEHPVNDSKGCGGVMRAAPCGFPLPDADDTFQLGCEMAALTHGHPSGYLPAGVQATLIWALLRGADLADALDLARSRLVRHPGHEETAEALDAAVDLAWQSGPPTAERLATLGEGWLGPEALAIAVYVALTIPPGENAGRDGLVLAVNHPGDSDSTGAITGNILGAAYGPQVFPAEWRSGVEVAPAIARLAAECTAEFC